MAGYGQFCPLAQASEILAERWTPLVIRELHTGSTRFNDIQRGVPRMSSSLLSARLRSLERAGIVVRSPRADGGHEYRLTPAGEELKPLMEMIATWGQRWVRRDVTSEDADPRHLMWTIRGCVITENLPPGRTVARFQLSDAPHELRMWWLVLRGTDVDLCLTDPGYEVDVEVHSDPVTLARIVVGERALAGAIRTGTVRLGGRVDAQHAFCRWFGQSRFAAIDRVASAPRGQDPTTSPPRMSAAQRATDRLGTADGRGADRGGVVGGERAVTRAHA